MPLLSPQLFRSVLFIVVFFGKSSEHSVSNREGQKGPAGRVFSGVKTRAGDMPFIMKLPVSDVSTFESIGCTAFLIHKQWALTAAHCYWRHKGINQTILLANTPPEPPPIRKITIDNFIRHPDFNEYPDAADIALLNLHEPIQDIEPVHITNMTTNQLFWSNSSADNWQGIMLTNAGYGQIARNTFADTLHKTYYYLEPKCPNGWSVDEVRNFCTRSGPAGEMGCSGDSGSPVLYELANTKIAVGVVSGGNSPCDHGIAPWIDYDRVVLIGFYLDWIKDEMCKVGGAKFPYMEYDCPST